MAQLTAPVTITSVTGKQINTKNGVGTIYEIAASDGIKYATFKAPLAQKAHGLVGGAAVALSFTTRQNGEYTNYSLQDIVDGAAPAAPGIPMAPAPAPAAAAAPAIPMASGDGQKDARITRLSAAKTAFDYAASAGLDEAAAFALAQRIEGFANGTVATPAAAPAQAQTADDGIPWED